MHVLTILHQEPYLPNAGETLLPQYPLRTAAQLLQWTATLYGHEQAAQLAHLQRWITPFAAKQCKSLTLLEHAQLQIALALAANPTQLQISELANGAALLTQQQLWANTQPLLAAVGCQQVIWHTSTLSWLQVLPGEIGLAAGTSYYPVLTPQLPNLLRNYVVYRCKCVSPTHAQNLYDYLAQPAIAQHFWKSVNYTAGSTTLLLYCRGAQVVDRLKSRPEFSAAVLNSSEHALALPDLPDWQQHFATQAQPLPQVPPPTTSRWAVWHLARYAFWRIFRAKDLLMLLVYCFAICSFTGMWLLVATESYTTNFLFSGVMLASFNGGSLVSAAPWLNHRGKLRLAPWGIRRRQWLLALGLANMAAYGWLQLVYVGLLLVLSQFTESPILSPLLSLSLIMLTFGNIIFGLGLGLWMPQRSGVIHNGLLAINMIALLAIYRAGWVSLFTWALPAIAFVFFGLALAFVYHQLQQRWE